LFGTGRDILVPGVPFVTSLARRMPGRAPRVGEHSQDILGGHAAANAARQ
jgi:hypothetical protein